MFRLLRSRTELRDSDQPLRVFGALLCGRCHDVKAMLTAAGVAFEAVDVNPREPLASHDRHENATLLAVFTWQDELLPAIIGRDWESCVPQDRIEAFCR